VIQGQDVIVFHVSFGDRVLFFGSKVDGGFQLLANGKTASGKPYNNEFMFTFRFDGEKIASVREFMDSKYVTHILDEEAKGREQKDQSG
jgi:hypothetical protein